MNSLSQAIFNCNRIPSKFQMNPKLLIFFGIMPDNALNINVTDGQPGEMICSQNERT